MQTATIEIRTYGDRQYKVVDGTWYDIGTPDEVVEILENARRRGIRLRLHYGDTTTGRDWMEEYDVEGRVGRSTGQVKIPLLLANRCSTGGLGILTHCIVKIRESYSGFTIYAHPSYQTPLLKITGCIVLRDGEVHARFKSKQEARRWAKKMLG